MARFTIRFPEDLAEWIDEQADAPDTSKAKVVRDAVRAAKERDSGDEGDTLPDDLAGRLDTIERRLNALEEHAVTGGDDRTGSVTTGDRTGTDPVTSGDAAAPAGGDNRTDPVTSGDDAESEAVTSGDSSDADEGGPAARAVETDVEAAARELVERVAENWNDDPERLAARKDAATVALVTAATGDETIGKSDDVVDELYDAHPVPGQSRETYWRENIRPVLSEVGTNPQGTHGYRVEKSNLF